MPDGKSLDGRFSAVGPLAREIIREGTKGLKTASEAADRLRESWKQIDAQVWGAEKGSVNIVEIFATSEERFEDVNLAIDGDGFFVKNQGYGGSASPREWRESDRASLADLRAAAPDILPFLKKAAEYIAPKFQETMRQNLEAVQQVEKALGKR